jgi:16S rRNA C967 or C1407 C5-methylase (RsmB/RsmF family)
MLKAENIEKFAAKLLPSERTGAFTSALLDDSCSVPALVWLKQPDQVDLQRVQYTAFKLPEWVEVIARGQKPGTTPAHESGGYYCADVSSVVFGMASSGFLPKNPVVVDLCAAPGGKSVLVWRASKPELLLSNEVVQKRVKILISNIKRCDVKPVGIFSKDVDYFATMLPACADLVIVDAPCSAQSLGSDADYPFHKSTINGNAKRQRRIIESAGRVVKPGGFLQYITCTFSEKENEKTIAWFRKRYPEFSPVAIPGFESLQSHLTDVPSYRIWPDQGLGRGGFLCLLRRDENFPLRNGFDWPTPLWSSHWPFSRG